jgi:hypothetical protein
MTDGIYSPPVAEPLPVAPIDRKRGRGVHGSPLQGCGDVVGSDPGFHPGMVWVAPLGLRSFGDEAGRSLSHWRSDAPVARTQELSPSSPLVIHGRATSFLELCVFAPLRFKSPTTHEHV